MDKLFCEEVKQNKAEDILKALKIDEEVLAIYPYGSRVKLRPEKNKTL